MHNGSCLCGGVTYTVTGDLRPVLTCHCTQCRRTSGHFGAATSVADDQFHITRDDTLGWFRSSGTASRGFCTNCGASLFWQPEAEARIAFAPGSLDGPTGLSTSGQLHVEDAGDYYAPEGPPPAVATHPIGLDCACLCGAVAFSRPGPAGDITACHCIQCRKLSGHYSASFDADETALRYSSRIGLAEYQTPAGGRRGFCHRCGSSLYFRAANGDFSVEAGAVTGPTGGKLTAHIFVAFKGDYYQIDDGLPQSDQW